ncbi:DUF4190 domain-containing protein [Actinomadura latina]|uniref:DUF4190 domain-containing protein n=1 Tax=Actinomadura latina TaxID=163603 RepID=A0A846YQS0_9ACTN|nr:DUF4190 domain-containing protein [Actinomadura latina]NKZ02609.1 DUF4190 domain-containing protein [Actinomadura latina]
MTEQRVEPEPGSVPTNSMPTNGMATASMVMGVLGLAPFGQFAVGAIVLGHIARRRIRRTGEGGRGRATVGLIFGYLFTVLWAAVLGITIWAYGVAFQAWPPGP